MWLLTTSNQNFSLLRLWMLASFTIFSYFVQKSRKLTHLSVSVGISRLVYSNKLKAIYADMDGDIFRQRESKSLFKIILVILVMNTLGGAVGGIYHFLLIRPYYLSSQLCSRPYFN